MNVLIALAAIAAVIITGKYTYQDVPGLLDGSRDMCILQADSAEGIYLAEFDLEQLRRYREQEVHGNAFRRPEKYGFLLDTKIEPPFIRSNYRK